MTDSSAQQAPSRWSKKAVLLLVGAAVVMPIGFWLTNAVQKARWAAQRSSDK